VPPPPPVPPPTGYINKSDVVAAMSAVKGFVANCYAAYRVPGLANLHITIAPDGSVSSVETFGNLAGTPEGKCIADVILKKAHFPPHDEPASINYPFMLR
jgi:hypothetical protein